MSRKGEQVPSGEYDRTEEHREAIRRGIQENGGRAEGRNANWRGGKTKHPLYSIYHDAKRRCENPRHLRYSDYGGRGIRMHPEWVRDFWAFVDYVGPRPDERETPGGRKYWQLDRIDNNRGYEPGNVRWASPSQQNSNTRPREPKATCRRGHDRTGENLYVNPRTGETKCRECSRLIESRRERRR